MQNTRYLIIGGSAAGIACAQTIKDNIPKADVTILSDEPDKPYFRPLIPYILTGKKTVSDISMLGSGPYTHRDLKVLTGCMASKVDTVNKIVFANTQEYPYDKLLIASGSRANIPKELEGQLCKGVFALRKLNDAREMIEILPSTKHVVMLGGGLVNLKTAFALVEIGIKVTLVVQSLEILSQIMEPQDAYLLKDAIVKSGINIITGKKAVGVIKKNNSALAVALDDQQEIPCEIVCIGKGVKPNVEFLDGSGIKVDGGVVVDRFTACNIPDIYSAGDVAVTYNPITGQKVLTGLWTNAVEMGKCAGLNMIGCPTAYAGTFGVMNATQIGGIPFVSMGTVHTKDGDFEVYTHKGRDSYRKVVFSKDGTRLIGIILISDISKAGIYRYLIREGRDITSIKDLIINHKINYASVMK